MCRISIPNTWSNPYGASILQPSFLHSGLHFRQDCDPLEDTALLARVFFFFSFLKVESCFQMQKTYGGFSCLFFQNANYQNNTLKHHFLLICQITIKSFLDAIILQDNKDYKQLPQLPIKKINIQLYDLRDLALDKVPFRSTLGNLFSLWKPYTSPSKATCYWWHIFSSGVQKEKLCLPLSALFTLLPVI